MIEPTPSATTAAATPPTNTTSSAQPTPATTTSTPPPTPGPDYKAELEKLRAQHDKRVKEAIIERRKFETQTKELRAQAAKAAEYEKRFELAKRNPGAFQQGVYGENWRQILHEASVNDAAPAVVIADAMQDMESRWQAKWDERENQAKVAAEQAARDAQARDLQNIRDGFAHIFDSTKADYPALAKRFKNSEQAANAVFAHIRDAWEAALQRDENGQPTARAEPMSPKQALDALEAAEFEYTQAVSTHDKYAPKFREALTPKQTSSSISPSKPQQVSQQQQSSTAPQQTRRTLSNDITGSTQGRQPPATLEERRQRAIERYNELRRR